MPADFEISPIIPPIDREPTPPAQHPAPLIQAGDQPVEPPAVFARHSGKLLKWFVIGAALLFVVSIASIWLGNNSFSANNVTMSLEASDRATSGDEITYTAKYKNNTKTRLVDLHFRLFYPAGAIALRDGSPQPVETEGFDVDQLNPGEEGTREFKVFLVGDRGEIKTTRLHLTFTPGTLKSSFEKDETITTTITALPVTLTLVAPPTALSGQSVQYILNVRNDSQSDLTDLKISFTYPDGFSPQTLQPVADIGKNGWNISSLNVGRSTRIQVDGLLTGKEQEVKTVAVTLQRKINDQYIDYVRTDSSTMISSPLLSVSISPADGRNYVSFAGDTLQYNIRYTNSSRFTLLGAILQVRLEGDMFDVSRLQVSNGSFNQATNTITFDSSGIPGFAQLSPGAAGTLGFSIPLKAGVAGTSGSRNFFVKATAQLSTPNIPASLDASQVTAMDSVTTKISAQPTISGTILYDNGAGTGPVPLKVGQETMVTVRWQLVNPGNDVSGVSVSSTLPSGVVWKGAAVAVNGGSAPAYDRNSSKVTWAIPTLPFGTGMGAARYEATFQIAVTPSSNQVGQSISLTGATTLTGTDNFVSQQVQAQTSGFTTDSIENHRDQGRVVQ